MPDEVAFLDREHRLEPARLHHRLLTECPVHRVEAHDPPFYVVSPYADTTAVLRDVWTYSSSEGPGVEYTPGGVLGSTDRPDHTRQRRVLAPRFTPAAMAALAPRVARLADELFEGFVGLGRGDFVELYAGPLPAVVIAELLGVSPQDRARFRAWSDDIVRGLGGEDLERSRQTRDEMTVFFRECVAERIDALSRADRARGDPVLGTVVPDDVLSCMAVAAHDEGLLDPSEIVQLATQMLVAGHETTTSLLGLMIYRMTQWPWILEQLRSDHSLIEPFIEESLRFDSPVQGLFRTATRDVTLHGIHVPKDSKVQILFAAANRDPSQWDEPDEFRLDRPSKEAGRHVSFGLGIHKCIGAPLARLEAKISLERIVEGMDDIVLDGEPEVVRPFILRGFSRLPIRWSAPSANA